MPGFTGQPHLSLVLGRDLKNEIVNVAGDGSAVLVNLLPP